MIREILMIVFVTISTMASQLLVKRGVSIIAEDHPALSGYRWLLAAMLSPSILTAIAIQGVGFFVWVAVVSRMKLGVAFAISGAFFYLLIAGASWYFYGERLNMLQWVGLMLISSGVVLVISQSN